MSWIQTVTHTHTHTLYTQNQIQITFRYLYNQHTLFQTSHLNKQYASICNKQEIKSRHTKTFLESDHERRPSPPESGWISRVSRRRLKTWRRWARWGMAGDRVRLAVVKGLFGGCTFCCACVWLFPGGKKGR